MAEQIGAAGAGNRIITLDVIRGIAVMGIFSVNVVAFAMIFPAYMNPTQMGLEGPADLATWFANMVVIDGKMRSLFSMLFGASMLLVIDRAVAAGRSGARVHYARMVVLAVIGLFHFFVIWFGDILFLYAMVGMVAFLFRRSSVRKLIGWSFGMFILSMAMMSAATMQFQQLEKEAHAPGAKQEQIDQWNESVLWGAMTEEKAKEEIAWARSALPDRTEYMAEHRAFEPIGALIFMLPETLALMLLGMAGYRSGYLTGDWPDRSYRKIAVWTIGLGALASLALALWTWSSGFDLPLLFFNFMVVGTPVRAAMALGYAALIILIFRDPSALRDRFAAVGRCAFTNYLGTSILAALVFYGDGLALFGRLSRFECWLIVPLFWLVMLAWSKPWLDRFNYGPFEWLWRSLARLELQPMRKRVPQPAGSLAA